MHQFFDIMFQNCFNEENDRAVSIVSKKTKIVTNYTYTFYIFFIAHFKCICLFCNKKCLYQIEEIKKTDYYLLREFVFVFSILEKNGGKVSFYLIIFILFDCIFFINR